LVRGRVPAPTTGDAVAESDEVESVSEQNGSAVRRLHVDGELISAGRDLVKLRETAEALERGGYSGATTAETGHDPFIPLAIAASHTTELQVGTAIAVAFARNPMTVASTAYDMAVLTQGRFWLGLGSQVKAHITRRYSMPWSHPAARMREFVLALRAIWHSWLTGDKLNFRGDFYTHTLMTEFFTGGENPYGAPPVYLAAVGELMTETCGEVADGLIVHAFSTDRYVRERTLPALARGAAKAGRSVSDLKIAMPLFVVTGDTEEQAAAADAGVRRQIAFYGSTPAYRPVLELHGWGELGDELNVLSRRQDWDTMTTLIDDDVLHAFAVVAEPAAAAKAVVERYGGLIDRMSFSAPRWTPREVWDRIAADIAAATS
jgi:probable F420-dependent oxidoreductase